MLDFKGYIKKIVMKISTNQTFNMQKYTLDLQYMMINYQIFPIYFFIQLLKSNIS